MPSHMPAESQVPPRAGHSLSATGTHASTPESTGGNETRCDSSDNMQLCHLSSQGGGAATQGQGSGHSVVARVSELNQPCSILGDQPGNHGNVTKSRQSRSPSSQRPFHSESCHVQSRGLRRCTRPCLLWATCQVPRLSALRTYQRAVSAVPPPQGQQCTSARPGPPESKGKTRLLNAAMSPNHVDENSGCWAWDSDYHSMTRNLY